MEGQSSSTNRGANRPKPPLVPYTSQGYVPDHVGDQEIPVPAFISEEQAAKLFKELTDYRTGNGGKNPLLLQPSEMELDANILSTENTVANPVEESPFVEPLTEEAMAETEESSKDDGPAEKQLILPKLPPPLVPSETNQPPEFFLAVHGKAVKIANQGSFSRCFGQHLDADRFGPHDLELGMMVCETIVDKYGQICEIIEDPKLGHLYRMNWFDRRAESLLYEKCYYTRDQLRLRTTGKRVVDESCLVPLSATETKKKGRARASTVPAERTFLNGWTENECAAFKPKDMGHFLGNPGRILKNDKTNQALWFYETDNFGKSVYPPCNTSAPLDLAVKLNACCAYYEDMDKKTAETARRKFKIRDGATSSFCSSNATIDQHLEEKEETLDTPESIQNQNSNLQPSVAQKEPKRVSKSKKLSTPQLSGDVQVPERSISPANYAALLQRINELENENSGLRTNALVVQLEQNRNGEMMKHFVETMQTMATKMTNCTDQQTFQTDRLEGLGTSFVAQGRELTKIKNQLLTDNKEALELIGQQQQQFAAQFAAQQSGLAGGSHQLVATARMAANRQLSDESIPLKQMMSPLQFTPSPRAKESSTKRSLDTALAGQATVGDDFEPQAKKGAPGPSSEPCFTNDSIQKIIAKQEGTVQPTSTFFKQPSVTVTEPTLKTPKFQKAITPSTEPLKPKKSARKPFTAAEPSSSSSCKPLSTPLDPNMADKVNGYMKQIDKGLPNGLNPKCARPFSYYDDPIYSGDEFRFEYLPSFLASMSIEKVTHMVELIAARFYFENVKLHLYNVLIESYKQREYCRIAQIASGHLLAHNSANNGPQIWDETLQVWKGTSEDQENQEAIDLDLAIDASQSNPSEDSEPDDDEAGAGDSEEEMDKNPNDLLVVEEVQQKLGGGGRNRAFVYPDDDHLLEGSKPLPLETTINEFMAKHKKGLLTTYVQLSVAENVCAACLNGLKGKSASVAWRSVFVSFTEHIITRQPPFGYWKNVNGQAVCDVNLFKDALKQCRSYMNAVVSPKEMIPSIYSAHEVQEMHYFATRHFEFVFDMFRAMRRMVSSTKVLGWPEADRHNYKFYLECMDHIRRHINRRLSSKRVKVEPKTPAGARTKQVAASSSSTKKAHLMLAAELDM